MLATKQILFSGTSTGLRDLTLANVITDATRRAAVEGDGLAVPGGFGVWPAAGNQIQNGNGTTNSTGWQGGYGSETVTRETTGGGPFGTTFIQCVTPAAADRGLLYGLASQLAVTAGSAYTNSAWLWGSGDVYLRIQDVGGTATDSSLITLTSTPTRYSVTKTAGVGITTQHFYVAAAAAAVTTIKCGGAQHEAGVVATPYMQSDGSDGARSAGRVTVPTQGVLTPTQGAVVARCYFPYANTARTGDGILLSFRDAANDLVEVRYDFTNAQWELERNNAGTGTVHTFADTWTAGSGVTVFGAYTAAALKLSVDAAAFTSTADTNIPTISATTADIGSDGSSGSYVSGNVRWAIVFKGTPTDADAALPWMTQNAVPTLSQIAQLSAASKPTLLIPADVSMARLLPAYFGGTL